MGQSHPSWGPGCPKGATVPISTYVFHGQDGSTNFGQMATELHPMLDILLTETERRGYIIRQKKGCYAYVNRYIAGTTIPSNHSRATAIDVNAVENGYGDPSPAFPAKIAHEVWEPCGWEWGGDWSGSGIDGMHLEYLGARSTVKEMTEKAERLFGETEDEMLDEYIDGQNAYQAKFRDLGHDPGEPNPDRPKHFKSGWSDARFAANNPTASGGDAGGEIPAHAHPHRHDEGKTGAAEPIT